MNSTRMKYYASVKDGMDYVGIAVDEPHRFEKENRPNRILPLRDWEITEAEALQYCYDKGFLWLEDGQYLYELLDRVSCYCCGNKNLKELKNMYLFLPHYWEKLKALQECTDRPFRRNSGETIMDLEERFIDISQPITSTPSVLPEAFFVPTTVGF